MIQLNFTMSELLHSDIAKKYNIYNVPDKEHLDNLLILIIECLQPIRNFINKPMIISSGYRNPRLNSHPLINGAPNSQHTTGQAVDFTVKGMTPRQIVEMIKRSGVEVDQCINERNCWVHLSYNKGNNRNQFFEIT
jgi:uncharacterized protein YcbK (DUF882 family)